MVVLEIFFSVLLFTYVIREADDVVYFMIREVGYTVYFLYSDNWRCQDGVMSRWGHVTRPRWVVDCVISLEWRGTENNRLSYISCHRYRHLALHLV